jgi:hypothetical protein
MVAYHHRCAVVSVAIGAQSLWPLESIKKIGTSISV